MGRTAALMIMILVATVGAVSAAESSRPSGMKSPARATRMSLLGTAVPVGLLFLAVIDEDSDSGYGILSLVGSVIGPGMGHAYAENPGRFWRGAGWRTVGWSGLAAAVAISRDDPDSPSAIVLSIAGSTLLLASTVYDIVSASDSAELHNAQFDSPGVSLVPLWFPQENSVGLVMSLEF